MRAGGPGPGHASQGGIGQQRAARREGWMFLLRESGQSGSVVSHEKKGERSPELLLLPDACFWV